MIGYSVAVCLLMTALLFLAPAHVAWGREGADRLQILFIGDTRGLLEPCG